MCEVLDCASTIRVRHATSHVRLTFVIYLMRDLAEFPACKTPGWKIRNVGICCARCFVSSWRAPSWRCDRFGCVQVPHEREYQSQDVVRQS